MCSKILEIDDMFRNLQNFEKFPQNFREIVQKFNIIQYYSILSLAELQNRGADAGAGPAAGA